MKRVLLTGASGFIGANAIEPLLSAGFHVHAVGRQQPSYPASDRLVWEHADLLDEDSRRRVVESAKATHLLHFGWYVKHGEFWDACENEQWLEASSDLFERFIENGGVRIVGAGTCAEYEWGGEESLNESNTRLQPASIYGECKAGLRDRLQRMPVSSAWGRIFFLFGEREDPNRLVPSVIRSLLSGEPAVCFNGDKLRDFLYVKDIAAAFVDVLRSELEGPLNIASGEPMSLRDLLLKIGSQLGGTDLIRFEHRASKKVEPNRIVADVTRLKEELKWQPRYTLERALSETIEWWKTK